MITEYKNPTATDCPTVVVLANGEMPRPGSVGFAWLQRAAQSKHHRLVCCDGAVNNVLAAGLPLPDAVVGDLDSLAPEVKSVLGKRLHHIAEQESNDLSKAVGYAMATYGAEDLCILGAFGLREDHTLGNASLLCTYISRSGVRSIIAPTNYGRFYALGGDALIASSPGTQLSIFNIGGAPLSTRGLRWELNAQILPELWMGTLNEAVEQEVFISATAPYLIYVADERKDG